MKTLLAPSTEHPQCHFNFDHCSHLPRLLPFPFEDPIPFLPNIPSWVHNHCTFARFGFMAISVSSLFHHSPTPLFGSGTGAHQSDLLFIVSSSPKLHGHMGSVGTYDPPSLALDHKVHIPICTANP